ncbi:hypothetical protein BASA60_001693 [Batrachochytrium salamandrivorans]|nr:hypothetical protein BASA60_001693 [Batrachochytrium salamandrivorans]
MQPSITRHIDNGHNEIYDCATICLDRWLHLGILLMVYKPDEVAAPPELIEGIVGDMGVIAIIPIVAFYGIGILTKDDWNSMLWSVVMLAMGGIALGKAVASSGLLALITDKLSPFLQELPLLYCIALLTGVVVIVTSFISHTVGALIILPVVAQIGASLPDPRPRTLVMAAALLCSGGMALPVSSFPNMNAISLEDPTGMPWLDVSDFLRIGVVSTGISWMAVMGIGYSIMTFIEFG